MSTITSRFATSKPQDDHAPLWAFITIKEKIGNGCGNRLRSRNFCEKVVKSSYSRVKAYLLRTLKNAFSVKDRNQLKAKIARRFYSIGLSFHLSRTPHFVSSYSFSANINLSGFLPLSYNALTTIFLKAIDGSKEYKDKDYMTNLIKDVTKENIDRNEDVFNDCRWIFEEIDDTIFIKTFIMNYLMRLTIFNEFSALKLLLIVDTRFASMIVMLKRLELLNVACKT
uniref:Uncharacterized protein n=1 Tax=Cajanus cajan TaxID=3821 RepID=A0A151SR15_CAJCA|nr:hypothetical protein KK1_003447 [Cajanus cajan]